MIRTKAFILFLFYFVVLLPLKGEKYVMAAQSDSLTLAQAFVNLTLTGQYFDTLVPARISRILAYEKKELTSISDSNFIKSNTLLHTFTNSLLYYLTARLRFQHQPEKSRQNLIFCKNQLDTAIVLYNRTAGSEYIYQQNEYFDFIEFSIANQQNLRKEILQLKMDLTPYFNISILILNEYYLVKKIQIHFHLIH